MHKIQIIGIVGGGQLGRMLTIAAHKLGFKVIVLDPTPNSPAAQVADRQIVGSFKDTEKIFELADVCDVMTFEIESANAEALKAVEYAHYEIASSQAPRNDERTASRNETSVIASDSEAISVLDKRPNIFPSAQILELIKDKFSQKGFLEAHGIACAKSEEMMSLDAIKNFGSEHGYPFLLKARFDAYDGRGNALIKEESEIYAGIEKMAPDLFVEFETRDPESMEMQEAIFKALKLRPLYCEAFVDFEREISVVVSRSKAKEQTFCFPVVETVHKDNICHTVVSPAPISEQLQDQACSFATKFIEAIDATGVFAIEMFVTKDGQVLVNEVAPRVHNSGHHTIEATSVSQFEQHIRAITGMDLVEPVQESQKAKMINILGMHNTPTTLPGIDGLTLAELRKQYSQEEIETMISSDILDLDAAKTWVHIYGKTEIKKQRKMGHVTSVA